MICRFLQPPWILLDLPGLHLRNSLNKCWYHATLHFLTCLSRLRSRCLSSNLGANSLEDCLFSALCAIFDTRISKPVENFFSLVMDFNGVDNRYGQIAVPDFLDYLCKQSPILLKELGVDVSTRLNCLKCQWISPTVIRDVSFKLYIPAGTKHTTLSDLLSFNSDIILSGPDAVFCGNCNQKTSNRCSRFCDNPDIFAIEVVRV